MVPRAPVAARATVGSPSTGARLVAPIGAGCVAPFARNGRAMTRVATRRLTRRKNAWRLSSRPPLRRASAMRSRDPPARSAMPSSEYPDGKADVLLSVALNTLTSPSSRDALMTSDPPYGMYALRTHRPGMVAPYQASSRCVNRATGHRRYGEWDLRRGRMTPDRRGLPRSGGVRTLRRGARLQPLLLLRLRVLRGRRGLRHPFARGVTRGRAPQALDREGSDVRIG